MIPTSAAPSRATFGDRVQRPGLINFLTRGPVAQWQSRGLLILVS